MRQVLKPVVLGELVQKFLERSMPVEEVEEEMTPVVLGGKVVVVLVVVLRELVVSRIQGVVVVVPGQAMVQVGRVAQES
tara:strand:+ start:233 stop:469 length:237 start_codon:yes stop_codon:yes gene_type:complete